MLEKKKKLIILDFDHTVFNTTRYVGALKRRFKDEFDIDEEVFVKYRDETKSCCVVIDMDNFVNLLPHEDKRAMHKAIHEVIQIQAATFVFGDVMNFIGRHHEKFDIVVVTHGDSEHQQEKIRHCGLPEYVDALISLESKENAIASLMGQYDEVHFIDDKAENIDTVKQAFPHVKSYFMKRREDKPYANTPSACDCADEVIEDLTFTIGEV